MLLLGRFAAAPFVPLGQTLCGNVNGTGRSLTGATCATNFLIASAPELLPAGTARRSLDASARAPSLARGRVSHHRTDLGKHGADATHHIWHQRTRGHRH